MKTLWLDNFMKTWNNDVPWIQSWALIGELRELLNKHVGPENSSWTFVNSYGQCTDRLPAGIRFDNDEDATIFMLYYV